MTGVSKWSYVDERVDHTADESLLVLVVALLLIGYISGTLVRHLVLVIPLVLAFLVAHRRPALTAATMLPLFVFWFGIMLLIWLVRLGVAPMVPGNYRGVENGLTAIMGGAAFVGAIAAIHTTWRHRSGASWVQLSNTGVGFAALQLLALWASFR